MKKRSQVLETVVHGVFLLLGLITVGCVLLISVYLIVSGIPAIQKIGLVPFLFGKTWASTAAEPSYGILPFILTSVYGTAGAIVLGVPLGFLTAVYLAKVAPPRLKTVLESAVSLLAGIPSVVYGYIGLTLLVPYLRDALGATTGFGVLAASLVLAIMIMPTILSISTDALNAVPKSLEEASLALGATWWQTMVHVIVPAAAPGILTAVVLAMARAIGETMAVQMLIGNTPQIVTSLLSPTATLTSNIVVEMGNTPFGSVWGNALFLMAFVLLLISLAMILVIRRFGTRRV